MQHRGRHRVGAEGEPADDVVAQVAGQLAHHAADQRGALVVQRQPAHVDVPVGLPPRRERDLPVHHRELDDQLEEAVAVGQRGEPSCPTLEAQGRRPTESDSGPGRRVRRRRREHLVDDVDGRVGGLHVPADHRRLHRR